MSLGFVNAGVKKELRHAEDGVEWRAELVGNHGEKGALEVGGGLDGAGIGLLLDALSLGGDI